MTNKTVQMTDALYEYLIKNSLRDHPVLAAIPQANLQDDLTAAMQIAPEQGQFMAMLVQLIGASRTLEIGTCTGYSTLCVAMALPGDGEVVACDIDEKYIALAKKFWQEAGMDKKIKVKLGAALASLNELISNGEEGKFDFAFIDADKTNYDAYYEACLKLVRTGGVIAIDNVLWGGSVIDESKQDEDTCAIRALNKKLHTDNRVSLSMLPLADGLTLLQKK